MGEYTGRIMEAKYRSSDPERAMNKMKGTKSL
jgi:hypothetical protein